MQDQAESLNRAENQRGLLEGARRKLEHFLSKKVESVNATITVGDVGMLTVQFLGRVLVAVPRTVFVNGDLALEYTFAEQGWAEGLAVWQFYLVEEAQHKYGLYAGLPPDDRKRISTSTTRGHQPTSSQVSAWRFLHHRR